jgi:hypothetical protein
MAIMTARKDETRKPWATPELRKTSIEQITATAVGPQPMDGGTSKPNNGTHLS